MKEELTEGSYQPGPYPYFEVQDPKRRTIAVAPFRDRVVHHAVVTVLEPMYERCFISDSYATRKGKGAHAAVFRAQTMLRKNSWYLKTDVQKFFDSVNQNTLLNLLEKKVKDRALLNLTVQIIRNGGRDGLGLPIGNLTSQFFANVYLNRFDYFVKQELNVKHYIRYMDDFVLYGAQKTVLKELLPRIEGFLADKLGLHLKPCSTLLQPQMHGLPFLGVRIFPALIRFLPENSKRMREKIAAKVEAFEQGSLSEKQFLDAMNSYHAQLTVYRTDALRRQILQIE